MKCIKITFMCEYSVLFIVLYVVIYGRDKTDELSAMLIVIYNEEYFYIFCNCIIIYYWYYTIQHHFTAFVFIVQTIVIHKNYKN